MAEIFQDPSPALSQKQTISWKQKRNYIYHKISLNEIESFIDSYFKFRTNRETVCTLQAHNNN